MIIIGVKGTHDIYNNEACEFSYVENVMKRISEIFAFTEVRPPVLEHSELFVRSVGESSDVVRKEMYTFLDKGDRSLTLRPEFTAGIARLIVQNKLTNLQELPIKMYYCGPVFRYERPQLGRYRQFNQFGVECIGHDNPIADVDVISLAFTILQSLGLDNVTLKINTLGDEESRNNYRDALKEYFSKRIDKMCPDCKQRLELNPLRILDCKVPEDKEIVKDAPKMSNYLTDAAKEKFKYILSLLEEMAIPYEVDDTLVRGLDYYSDVVFEFHYKSSKGNDYGAIGAGGHYDKLIKEVGGPDVPGVGFSFGVERLVSVLKDDELIPNDVYNNLEFYVMPMGAKYQPTGIAVANIIRMNGYSVDMCLDDIKLGSMFKRAEKKNAKFAIIIGENEVANGKVILKNLHTQEQLEVKLNDLKDTIDELFEEHECCCGDDCDCDCEEEGHECHCHCHDKKEN
ncbi:MAG: histidine--tRNA ligase [Bacilli bacterium]|nr:histidine--tRNA ligase [Bacilli bacterium]